MRWLRVRFGMPMLRAASLLAVTSAVGCWGDTDLPREAEPLWTGPQAGGQRVLGEPEWESLWVIGTSEDEILARPGLLAVRDSLIVWWDYFDRQVTAATLEGDILWRFGGPGEGPGEFESVGAVAIDEDATIVVLDSDNQRLTRLSQEGALMSMDRLPEGYWRGLSLQPSREVVISGYDAEAFAWLDSTGEVLRRFDPPWAGFGPLSTIQKQGKLLTGSAGRWAYAFLIGNGWFPYRGAEALPYLGQSVEHTVFPGLVVTRSGGDTSTRFAQSPTGSTVSGWIEGDTLNIFFEGESTYARQILDQYSWADGRYLRSLVLPVFAQSVAGQDGLIIAIVNDPAPTIRAFRPRASTAN